jgi:hypothetical protein
MMAWRLHYCLTTGSRDWTRVSTYPLVVGEVYYSNDDVTVDPTLVSVVVYAITVDSVRSSSREPASLHAIDGRHCWVR